MGQAQSISSADLCRTRVVGQWGGAGGAVCEDHLALACGRLGISAAVFVVFLVVASMLQDASSQFCTASVAGSVKRIAGPRKTRYAAIVTIVESSSDTHCEA